MKLKSTPSSKKYFLLLLGVILVAGGLWSLLGDKLDFTMLGRTVKAPTDTEENLAYGLAYYPASDNVLERDGICLKNFGTELKAQDLESGVTVTAADIQSRSEKPIVRFSEYSGYFYMYDGETVYRTTVNDGTEGKVRTVVEGCLKFEPMGNYIYSLQMKGDEKRLYRCTITGTYEKMLFTEAVDDFWAYGGNLLLKLNDGRYRWYDVITQESLEHTLPIHARNISLDGDYIFYLDADGDSTSAEVYRRPCNLQQDTALPLTSVAVFCAASGNIGALLETEDGSSLFAAWCPEEAKSETEVHIFRGKSFSKDCAVDVSSEYLFITEADGATWYTPLEQENWTLLFDGE